MARSGINKNQVHMARDRLLAQGKRPTVDAVRVELGNTGSKATIHRYLKELGEESPLRTIALNDTLSDLVSRLAAQLQQESQEALEQAYKTELDNLAVGQQLADDAERRIAQLEAILVSSEQQKAEAIEESRQLILRIDRLTQQLADQNQVLKDRSAYIESLLAEIKTLNSQLADAASIHRQLDLELKAEREKASSQVAQVARIEELNGRIQKELDALRRQLGFSDTARKTLELELARVQSELKVKDQLFEKLSARLMVRPERTE